MDYEKKYKEVQGWIEKIYPTLQHEQQMEAEAFFPELKESEDERIRKEIVQLIQCMHEEDPRKERWLAWLEKQEGCEYIKKDWLEHIKQSWYKEGFIDGKYSGGTSKEWTINDAAIFKELIDFLENGTAKLQHDLTKYANWLKIQFTPIEKQGKQFSVDKLEPKFKVKYAGSEYNILEVKDIAGVAFYGIEDEPNHIDYVKAENCEIISGGYGIKENGCSFPTKPINK